MNTRYLKKNAIASKLGHLFHDTCQYSPEVPARWGPIEPHDLREFRAILSDLANKHYLNDLQESDLKNARAYVWGIGSLYGHCTGSYTTGTWGVRYTTLQDISKILAIGDFDLIEEGKEFDDHSQHLRVLSGYHLSDSGSWVNFKVQSIDYPESNAFEYCLDIDKISWLQVK